METKIEWCKCDTEAGDNPECKIHALARLAPELLAALKEAVESHWNGVPYGAVPKWKSLIAKAEGKCV